MGIPLGVVVPCGGAHGARVECIATSPGETYANDCLDANDVFSKWIGEYVGHRR
jgi:hypothetical protein